MKKVAFCGGLIFNSNSETFVQANILCEDGYIKDITRDSIPYDYEIISVEGKYVLPGLVDVHTHGVGGYDFNYANDKQIPEMCHTYAKAGTTSVMATLASDTVSHLMNSIFAINQNRLRLRGGYANIIGIHMEGRYLNPEMKGAHMLELLAPPVQSELNTLALAMMPPPIHFSMAPELPGAKEFLKLASELSVTVGIAHTNATYEEALEAVKNGARSFTHTFNAMTKVHHRNPGAAICALNCNDAYAEIICDGEHVHPAMVRLAYKSKPKDKIVLVTDSMCATCAPEGYYKIAGTDVYVKNGRAVDVNGTLAGSTLTMFKAMKNMMAFCNISLNEAIKYATINPARMVKADFVGKIAKCYRADFITVSDITNPEIDNVYIGGCEVK
ncbi:MAG: N-acetylglucosamine-6-phosphate deacetylase [Clostridia bacterium]|nr:N-acetylglucosamine-6-phosphate deacetylase [Clostridia bacterium]